MTRSSFLCNVVALHYPVTLNFLISKQLPESVFFRYLKFMYFSFTTIPNNGEKYSCVCVCICVYTHTYIHTHIYTYIYGVYLKC